MTTASHRITSIDFWRGVALVTIFVDHIPGNVYENLTQRNFGFSDAAELFVFLAGIAAAFAYLSHMGQGEAALTSLRVGLRASKLYIVHLATLVVGGAIICATVLVTQDQRILETTQFDALIGDPVAGLFGLATLALQPPYMNILPLYIALLVFAPVLMLLVRWHMGVALALSGALYLLVQFTGLTFWSYPREGAWFFNPLAWQFLFTIGLCVGKSLSAQGLRHPGRPLLAIAAAALLFALVWTRLKLWGVYELPLPRFIWDIDKTNLSLPRLFHILALATVLSTLPLENWAKTSAFARPLVLMGKHSLPVFTVGTILAIAGQMIRVTNLGDLEVDLVFIPLSLFVLFGLAWVLEWNGTAARKVSAAVAASPAR